MKRTLITALSVLLLAFGVGCDAYLNLPTEVQQKVVTAKTVEAWKNKGNSELLKNLSNELNSLPEPERSEAQVWASNVWRFLDAVKLAQHRKAAAAAAGGDCFAAARRHFPQSQWGKATQIIKRESGGNPYAKNKKSSASGCFQIVRGSWQHPGVSWSAGRFNADANARAAYLMWRGNGWNCTCTWAATA